jgi:hypothetical protein
LPTTEGHFRIARLWRELGRTKAALAEYQAARSMYKKLTGQFPGIALYQHDMAGTHHNLAGLLPAVKAGFKDAAQLAKDAELDLLRRRDEFKKLPAELKTGQKNVKE